MACNLVFTTAGMKDYLDMRDKLLAGEFYLHHVAWASGYVPKNNKNCPSGILVEEYHGRFGEGYKLHRHDARSTRFHRVAYMIREDGKNVL